MSYDNTKLDDAISRWVKRDCSESFGETYAGDLLNNFEEFCADTGAMKRSPGRVAFGKCLARREYEKRKVCGLTYWAGIVIKKPPEFSKPRENTKSPDTKRMNAQRERQAESDQKTEDKAAEKKSRAAKVKKRMKKESKKVNQNVKQVEPADD